MAANANNSRLTEMLRHMTVPERARVLMKAAEIFGRCNQKVIDSRGRAVWRRRAK